MEQFLPSIWNVLHDGGIDRVDGNVPGDVRVFVAIEYLRERFPDDGEELIVTLTNCSRFSWRAYQDKDFVSDLDKIGKSYMSILSAEMVDNTCRVFGDYGVIELQCDGGSIRLDSGREISLKELLDEAEAYWDEWETKSGKK